MFEFQYSSRVKGKKDYFNGNELERMNELKGFWEGLDSQAWLDYKMEGSQYIKKQHKQMPVEEKNRRTTKQPSKARSQMH